MIHALAVYDVQDQILLGDALGLDLDGVGVALFGQGQVGFTQARPQTLDGYGLAAIQPLGKDTREQVDGIALLEAEHIRHVLEYGQGRPQVLLVSRLGGRAGLGASLLAPGHEGRGVVDGGVEVGAGLLVQSHAEVGAGEIVQRHGHPQPSPKPARAHGQASLALLLGLDVAHRARDEGIVRGKDGGGEAGIETAVGGGVGDTGQGGDADVAVLLHRIVADGFEQIPLGVLAGAGQIGDIFLFAQDPGGLQGEVVTRQGLAVVGVEVAVVIRAVLHAAVSHAPGHETVGRGGDASRGCVLAGLLPGVHVEAGGGQHAGVVRLQIRHVSGDLVVAQDGVGLVVDDAPHVMLPALHGDPTAVGVLTVQVDGVILHRFTAVAQGFQQDLRLERLTAGGGAVEVGAVGDAHVARPSHPLPHDEEIRQAGMVGVEQGIVIQRQLGRAGQEPRPLGKSGGHFSLEVYLLHGLQLPEVGLVGEEDVAGLGFSRGHTAEGGDLLGGVGGDGELLVAHGRLTALTAALVVVHGVVVGTQPQGHDAVGAATAHGEEEVVVHPVHPAAVAHHPHVAEGELHVEIVGGGVGVAGGDLDDHAALGGDRRHGVAHTYVISLGKEVGRAALVAVPAGQLCALQIHRQVHDGADVHGVGLPRQRVVGKLGIVGAVELHTVLRDPHRHLVGGRGAGEGQGMGGTEGVVKGNAVHGMSPCGWIGWGSYGIAAGG